MHKKTSAPLAPWPQHHYLSKPGGDRGGGGLGGVAYKDRARSPPSDAMQNTQSARNKKDAHWALPGYWDTWLLTNAPTMLSRDTTYLEIPCGSSCLSVRQLKQLRRLQHLHLLSAVLWPIVTSSLQCIMKLSGAPNQYGSPGHSRPP